LKINWIRKVDIENHRTIGPLMRKEEEEVVSDITNTSKSIPIREHAIAQVHPLLGNIGGMGWMT
jgi:hypothetical protein